MKLERFKVERWMDEYEGFLTYDLGETCIDSLEVGELLDICGVDRDTFFKTIADKRLVYGWIHGSPEFNQGVANLYKDLKPEQVVPMHGAIGANHSVIACLVEPTDNVVSVLPTYQQHYSIPASYGAEVRKTWLKRENNFMPNVEEIRSLVDKNTKLIAINNPDNPTGAFVPEETMKEIVEIARANDAYILCDEVYRGEFEDGSYMYSICDLYEKGVSTGSMSKVFGLAGLRMGWIATKDAELMKAVHGRRDYDTISLGTFDDILASIALANKDKIFARNNKILFEGRKILDQWVNETEGISYVKPVAGTTALVYYDKKVPSFDFCVHLVKDRGVLVTPGEAFDMEGCFRIGYAFSPDVLKKGLDIIAQTLSEYE